MEPRKQAIIDALSKWIRQRPGLDPRNYDYAGYRAESRSITRDKREAETLLAAVKWRDGITADDLIRAAGSAYCGRLTITLEHPITEESIAANQRIPVASVDYCTGQYWPTEYRRAVCAVLASALWEYTREHAMPKPIAEGRINYDTSGKPADDVYDTYPLYPAIGKTKADVMKAGDWLRAHFRKEFGRSIASRWFN
jgi:hypothetical protein